MNVTGSPSDLQLIDLVLHQGDQRRDDQRQPVQHQGRQLVAEAFAAAGGHDAQAIASCQHGRNDLLLAVAEGRRARTAADRIPSLRRLGLAWVTDDRRATTDQGRPR